MQLDSGPGLESFQPEKIRILRLPANAAGTDYVCGDLHGNADQLRRCLDAARFDPDRDRVFFTGDLLDRGPGWKECFAMLALPCAYSVMGNHELMLIQAAQAGFSGFDATSWLSCDGAWAMGQERAMLAEMAEKACRLPHVIAVGQGPERFNVLHAEALRDNGKTPADDLWLDSLHGTFDPDLADLFLWGRSLKKSQPNSHLPLFAQSPGLSKTFCGHSALLEPSVVGRQAFLDGASWVEGYGAVSICCARTGQWRRAKNNGKMDRGLLDWANPNQGLRLSAIFRSR